MERKTPLYDCHVKWGGKIVPFAGFQLPVQYGTGVIAEHMAVRTKAGLFDVSHMGEALIEGPDALENLQCILTNDFTNMQDGQCRYTLMCNEEGGVIDDLIVYRRGESSYLLVLNASNTEKDIQWLKSKVTGDAAVKDLSDDTAQLALQGPLSREILAKVCRQEEIPEKYYSFREDITVAGARALVSRTGYTGEDGFEIYCGSADAATIWEALLEAGKDQGLIPCGLGARDTLRLEAAMPLYGHEMDETVLPQEAGLGFAVKMNKETFIGKENMESKLPAEKCRVGLKITGRGIAREGCDIYMGEEKVGKVTSGTHCPCLGYAVAMASIDKARKEPGTEVTVDVRGRRIAAEVVGLPFYKRG